MVIKTRGKDQIEITDSLKFAYQNDDVTHVVVVPFDEMVNHLVNPSNPLEELYDDQQYEHPSSNIYESEKFI